MDTLPSDLVGLIKKLINASVAVLINIDIGDSTEYVSTLSTRKRLKIALKNNHINWILETINPDFLGKQPPPPIVLQLLPKRIGYFDDYFQPYYLGKDGIDLGEQLKNKGTSFCFYLEGLSRGQHKELFDKYVDSIPVIEVPKAVDQCCRRHRTDYDILEFTGYPDFNEGSYSYIRFVLLMDFDDEDYIIQKLDMWPMKYKKITTLLSYRKKYKALEHVILKNQSTSIDVSVVYNLIANNKTDLLTKLFDPKCIIISETDLLPIMLAAHANFDSEAIKFIYNCSSVGGYRVSLNKTDTSDDLYALSDSLAFWQYSAYGLYNLHGKFKYIGSYDIIKDWLHKIKDYIPVAEVACVAKSYYDILILTLLHYYQRHDGKALRYLFSQVPSEIFDIVYEQITSHYSTNYNLDIKKIKRLPQLKQLHERLSTIGVKEREQLSKNELLKLVAMNTY